MTSTLERMRNGDSEPDPQDETISDSLKYGFFKKLLDRWRARQDARKGLPAYSKQPVHTPAVEAFFAKFLTLFGSERERWNKKSASLRREEAKLTDNIRTFQEDLDRAQRRLDRWQSTTSRELFGADPLDTWRLRSAFRADETALEETRRRLAQAQAKLEQFTADIASLYNQHLDRQKQIVGHIWLRIANYRAELIRAHPHGDRLSTVIKWGPIELAHALDGTNELEQKLIELSKPRPAIEPPEKN